MESTESYEIETTPAAPQPSRLSVVMAYMWEILKTVGMALVLYFAISFVTDRVRVENISMQPTLYEGELLVVNKLAYRWAEPARGDIIVFHFSHQPPEDYIKRVIGIPGDVVQVRDRQVFVNGAALQESYIAESPEYYGEWVVPQNSLFVLGDNRNRSSDSHVWGFVPFEEVVGRAVLIYWPFNSAQILKQPVPVSAGN